MKILRIASEQTFQSASIFEDNFRKYIGQVASIHSINSITVYRNLGIESKSLPTDFKKFSLLLKKMVAGYDYISCAHEVMILIPLLLGIRNSANINFRIILVAHSPGVCCYDWAMIGPLMQKGDMIIAQSRSGLETIRFIYPALAKFVVLNHSPMPFLSDEYAIKKASGPYVFVTLARIHEDKLIHRQIEALSVLIHKFKRNAVMKIAGSLFDPISGKETVYAILLKWKVVRLGLSDRVEFVGSLNSVAEKVEFIKQGHISVNLSVCLEESCPKAIIETLSLGVPVVATNWDGMRDTVGPAGILVDMYIKQDGNVDVDPDRIAEALEQLIVNPIPAQICQDQARKFLPEKSQATYLKNLKANLKHTDFTNGLLPLSEKANIIYLKSGLLKNNSFLRAFNYNKLFEIYWEYLQVFFARINGIKPVDGFCLGEKLSASLLYSTKKHLSRFFAKAQSDDLNIKTTLGIQKNISHVGVKSELIRSLLKKKTLKISMPIKEFFCVALSDEGELNILKNLNIDDMQESQHSNFYKYFLIEKAIIQGNLALALKLFNRHNRLKNLFEHDAVNIKQVCKITNLMKQPKLAMDWLKSWLDKYPDSPQSGEIWLRQAFMAWKCGEKYKEIAVRSISRVLELYPDDKTVCLLKEKINAMNKLSLWALMLSESCQSF